MKDPGVSTGALCAKLKYEGDSNGNSVLIANGQRVSSKITDSVDIHWKNRVSSQRAVVIPGTEKILLGAIALEDMDLIVNPVTRELAGAHGDVVETMAL